MEEKIETIKEWLGTGSINIFGLPMSGKDTQGIKLAETLGAKFLSSGLIIRAMEKETKNNFSKTGALIPTNLFYEWVLPYFDDQIYSNIHSSFLPLVAGMAKKTKLCLSLLAQATKSKQLLSSILAKQTSNVVLTKPKS